MPFDALVHGAIARLVLLDAALHAGPAHLEALLHRRLHTLLTLVRRVHCLALVRHRLALVVTYVHGTTLHRQQGGTQLQPSESSSEYTRQRATVCLLRLAIEHLGLMCSAQETCTDTFTSTMYYLYRYLHRCLDEAVRDLILYK